MSILKDLSDVNVQLDSNMTLKHTNVLVSICPLITCPTNPPIFLSDIDECANGGACSGGTCINTEGGFECQCPPDWKLSSDGTYCICK